MMLTHANHSGSCDEKQRRRVDTATAQIKRVIHAGEAVTGRIARESQALVFSKHGGEKRQVDARVESSADLDNDDNHCSDAAEIPTHHSESSSPLGRTSEEQHDTPSLQCSDMFVSLLVSCAVLFQAVYTSYCHKLSIFTNKPVPLYVVMPWICLSFFIGRYFDSIFAFFFCAQSRSQPEALVTPSPCDLKKEKLTDIATLQQEQPQQQRQQIIVTKHLLRKLTMGRLFGKEVQAVHPSITRKDHLRQKKNGFWSILSLDTAIRDAKELERAIKPNLNISNVLMKHLLTYPDFRKTGVSRFESSQSIVSGLEAADKTRDEQITPDSTIATNEHKDSVIGNAILNNVHEASFEEDNLFSYIVEPLCSFRGMDMFLSDCPEGEIWRQPLLNQCGLRHTPTFIGNIMLPYGNMTVYLKLPSWFDDWDNIPAEKDDDEPEVKALKRFLSGDNGYRNQRAKLVPFVVDGPMAIRLIKPKPQDFTLHGIRHPVTWHEVPKSIDAKTGQVSSALLEFDIDLFSNKAIRKVTSMVRPHLSKITVDIALILSKPQGSEVDEPSACIGMWRIDKVDFESCAVFPEKSVDELVQEMKSFIALEEMGCDRG